jgi:hypothetical protein
MINEVKMPKTKLQDLTFSVMMVITMVYCMTLYNIALETGFAYITFWIALKSMWVEAVIAFFVQRYVARPLVQRIVNRLVDMKETKQLMLTTLFSLVTVFIMAPCMTFIVNILHHGVTKDLMILWLPKLVVNFPFALIIQTYFVGPLIRWVFSSSLKYMERAKA